MTKIHKDIAMHLMECVQDEEYTDQATIKVGYSVWWCLRRCLSELKTLVAIGGLEYLLRYFIFAELHHNIICNRFPSIYEGVTAISLAPHDYLFVLKPCGAYLPPL